MAELIDQYLADMQSAKINGKKSTTIRSDKSRIENHIRPKLGRYRVAAISSSQIEEFILSTSSGSAGRILALLSSIFSFGIKDKLLKDNPCKGVTKPKSNRKTRRLAVAEYAQLGSAINSDAVNPTASAVVKFLLVTGFRSGEARFLKWNELDIERRIVTLTDTKTGKSIRPLSTEAIRIIEAQQKNCEYVFAPRGRPIGNVNSHFARLKMPDDISPHTLRHSYASLAGDMGLADHTIARLLGHRQSSITSRYIHMEKAIIEASDLVANATLKLMRPNF
jgi:integrase